ncbi:MAG: hypothetical protein ABI901_13325, partial [Roseiflexaceae bacterium]
EHSSDQWLTISARNVAVILTITIHPAPGAMDYDATGDAGVLVILANAQLTKLRNLGLIPSE